MALFRLIHIFLRLAEFACAAVCLGLSAWFLDGISHGNGGPRDRTIYIIVISCVSLIASLVMLIPSAWEYFHWPLDLILSLAWFAAFGALVEYIHRVNCGPAFHWSGLYRGGFCDKWKANEAFAFIAACFWFVSTAFGYWFFHHKNCKNTVTTKPVRRRFTPTS